MKRVLDSSPIDTFDKRSRLTSEALARNTAAFESHGMAGFSNSTLPVPTSVTSPTRNELPKVLQGNELRKGKWTPEEEAYANRIIYDFEEGLLDIPPRTHLRYYLALVLHCEQMRISKKYRGMQKVGKQIYVPMPNSTPDQAAILAHSRREREYLRQRWYQRLFDIEAGGTIANPKNRACDVDSDEASVPPRRSVMQQPILPMPPQHARYVSPMPQHPPAEEFDYQADWIKRAQFAVAYATNHTDIINLIHEGKNIIGVLDQIQHMNGGSSQRANDKVTYRLFWALVEKEKEFRVHQEIFSEQNYPHLPQQSSLQHTNEIEYEENKFLKVKPEPQTQQETEETPQISEEKDIAPTDHEEKQNEEDVVTLSVKPHAVSSAQSNDNKSSLSSAAPAASSASRAPSLSTTPNSVANSTTTTLLPAHSLPMSSMMRNIPSPLHLQHPSMMMPPPPNHRSMPPHYMHPPYGYQPTMYNMQHHYAMQQQQYQPPPPHFQHHPHHHQQQPHRAPPMDQPGPSAAQARYKAPATQHVMPRTSLNEHVPTMLNNLDLQGLLYQSYFPPPSPQIGAPNYQGPM